MTAAGTFTGFGAGAVEWFAGLERDNSRAYMAGTREVFETQVREPMVALLTELAGERGGEVKLFRQHRDVRFAKDRSPYKITTYGVLVGRPGTAAGLYAELSSAGLYAGSGYHDMAPDQLARFRVGVDSPAGELLSRVVDGLAGSLSLSGEALRGVPRGYRRDHPRVVLLRRTALVAGAALPPGPALSSRSALEHTAGAWNAAGPLCEWLDTHVGASDVPPEVRYGPRRR